MSDMAGNSRRIARAVDRRLLSRFRGALDLAELDRALDSLGIVSGDNLLVHSALSALLYARYDAAAILRRDHQGIYAQSVLDRLLARVGPSGTLVMPTEFIADYTEAQLSGRSFKLHEAPSRRGFLTELFRRTSGATRSTGPIYNLTKIGPSFDGAFANHHMLLYAQDDGSPWAEFESSGGKVLFLGVDFEANSFIHRPEYILKEDFPLPVFLGKPTEFLIDTGAGKTAVRSYAHGITWPVQTVNRACFYLQRKYGFYRHTKLGRTTIWSMKVADQTEALFKELERGMTWYHLGREGFSD
jgi:aminoglycoside N3'-acetyltransferase